MQLIVISRHVGDCVGLQTGGIDYNSRGKFKVFVFGVLGENSIVAGFLFYSDDFSLIYNMRFIV